MQLFGAWEKEAEMRGQKRYDQYNDVAGPELQPDHHGRHHCHRHL